MPDYLTNLIYVGPPIVLIGYILNKLYFNGPSCKSENLLPGKVVIITGSNCGIGYETALDLARRRATIIMACRDINKAQIASDKIKLETNNQNVFIEAIDLESLKSIKDFAERFNAKYNRLDILINNAGLAGIPYSKTKDGFEKLFGVMHLGHFYLTNLLINRLKSTTQSRIINVSSDAHKFFSMNWDDLQSEKSYRPMKAYSNAKLANCLFTIELARRFKDDGITSVALHPGLVRTEIARDVASQFSLKSLIFYISLPFVFLFSKSCKQGAQTTIHCSVDDEVLKHSGRYYQDCKLANSSKEAQDLDAAKKLWDISVKLVGL